MLSISFSIQSHNQSQQTQHALPTHYAIPSKSSERIQFFNDLSITTCKATNDFISRELDEKTFSLIQSTKSEILFEKTRKPTRKRRIYSHVHLDAKKSGRRFRANDRERRRMDSLNGALDALKGCIPVPKSKKRMTKLHVLRLACNYIKELSELLEVAAGQLANKHDEERESRDARINGFSVAQRFELLSHTGRLYQYKPGSF